MAKSYDHIIFVGFPAINPESEGGERALVRIMNAANVDRKKIHFFDGSSNPQAIIRGSFIPDKAQQFGYQIGDSLCIASSSIGSKRHAIEKLVKVGIEVRTGYQDINFMELSESEISEWMKTGKYTPRDTAQESDGSESSLLDDLLSGFGDDAFDDDSDSTNPESTEKVSQETLEDTSPAAPVPATETSSEDNAETSGGDSDDTGFDVNDFDLDDFTSDDSPSKPEESHEQATPDTPEEVREAEKYNDPEGDDFTSFFEESGDNTLNYDDFAEKIVDDTADKEDLTPKEAVTPPSVSSTSNSSHQGTSVSDSQEDEDDFIARINNSVSDGAPSMSSSWSESEKAQEKAPSPSRSQHSVEDDFEDDNLKDVEEYRRKNNVSTNMGGGDDLDYVNQALEERKRAEKRKRKQLEREREEAQRSRDEEQSAAKRLGASDDTIKSDKEAQDILHQATAMSEETHDEHGNRKNYYDYLTPRNQRDQKIAENVQKEFGNIREMDMTKATANNEFKDAKYVGRGTGRIILCTAGKGGVGKSLVSNGMASALSLARAKELSENPGASTARTWLIESDYNSPQLAAAYKTKNKHLGNVAATLASSESLDNEVIREAIEDNAFVDPETGIYVLACPPLNSKTKNAKIPYAISLAVKYASDNGDDVIIDHGNLTTGEYSTLDKVLAMDLAHRVVIVCNMGCIPETQSALSILTERELGSSVTPRTVQSISVVLNSAREEQFYIAQEQLKPFGIMGVIQPVDALRAENSLRGDTYLTSAPQEVRKKIIDRCGLLLTKLGYHSMLKYFAVKSSFAPKKRGKKSWIRRITDRVAGD